ncbi:MAG: electron transfer flavoprotein-ubiquinone oxidoreductase [Hyphomicrobiaceae bacterium]
MSSEDGTSNAELPERDSMDFDVVIVGGGPAGLSAAIRLKQRAGETDTDLSVVVLEKGSEIGAHILSGAVIDPQGLDQLIPDWREKDCPLQTKVTKDRFLVLGPAGEMSLPTFLMPPLMNNHGNYVGSLGTLTRWLGEQAMELGVEVYPGFAASEVLYDDNGAVVGVATGDMGIDRNGQPKDSFVRGMELRGKYTMFAEGVRGSLSKELIEKFNLDKDCEPQKYGIGLKELWEIPTDKHQPGLVQHSFGWPLDNKTGGGSFVYHYGKNLVSVGFVVHLNYANPYLSPYDEFQRFKTHPAIQEVLEGGKRIAYGARAITEGGWQSLPKLVVPGGTLLGCSAGMVNVPRIKGSHNAVLSGIAAADAAYSAIASGRSHDVLEAYETEVRTGAIASDLKPVRNAKPLWSKFGTALGIALGGVDMWMNTVIKGIGFGFTLRHGKSDWASLKRAKAYKPMTYPKPDGVLTFDKLTNVSFSATNHEEDQRSHLLLANPEIPVTVNLPEFGEPAQRYCPAGVYEIVEGDDGRAKFQINAQNCVHCKTCDIKDPSQNITWVCPEGGGGPNYAEM